MHPLTGSSRPDQQRGKLATLLVLVALLAAAGCLVGPRPAVAGEERVAGGVRPVHLEDQPRSAPAVAFPRFDAARRAPSVPAAVLATAIVLTGWATGRRFGPVPRPPVRSWTGGRAGRDRAPPLPAV
jgi:hypothetical protein